jgi:hypothetical protein
MHPLLLHQIADDTVTARRRSDHHHHRPQHRRRIGARAALWCRAAVGGLLITVGTRVAGTRHGDVGLQHRPSA